MYTYVYIYIYIYYSIYIGVCVYTQKRARLRVERLGRQGLKDLALLQGLRD